MLNANFPAPPKKQKGSPGKPRCKWRSKIKYCKGCGAVITNLPRSLFLQRTFCSKACQRQNNTNKIAHKKTFSRETAGYMLAEYIQQYTDWDWRQCSVVAVEFMQNYQYIKKRDNNGLLKVR